jgi:hypothetical protein
MTQSRATSYVLFLFLNIRPQIRRCTWELIMPYYYLKKYSSRLLLFYLTMFLKFSNQEFHICSFKKTVLILELIHEGREVRHWPQRPKADYRRQHILYQNYKDAKIRINQPNQTYFEACTSSSKTVSALWVSYYSLRIVTNFLALLITLRLLSYFVKHFVKY